VKGDRRAFSLDEQPARVAKLGGDADRQRLGRIAIGVERSVRGRPEAIRPPAPGQRRVL
jgi:hypothetical protein